MPAMLNDVMKEANKRLGSVEPLFPNDDAVLFEKATIGREQEMANFLDRHPWVPIIICLLYGAAIYFAQKWMQHRPIYKLRPVLVVWNLSLAVFSAFGAYRCVLDTMVTLKNYGLTVTVCHPSGYLGVTGFWAAMFVFSKVLELGDTFFIVLRKQKLQTLHWYHHITVLLYVFYTYPTQIAVARYFCAINYSVHTIMYSYFALRAAQIRMPYVLSLSITLLQLSQLFVGMWASLYALYLYHTGTYCSISTASGVIGFLMYASFFYGFLRLFFDKYLSADGGEAHGEGSAVLMKQRRSPYNKFQFAGQGKGRTAVTDMLEDNLVIHRKGV